MDRKLSSEEKNKARFKLWIRWFVTIAIVIGTVIGISFIFDEKVDVADLTIARAEISSLESSVSASGRIVPLYERSIVSPVATQIMEVFHDEGDSVKLGESLMRLDL